MAFTYPFCYIPDNEIVNESKKIINFIDSRAELREIFSEGKMMGVMIAENSAAERIVLKAFSGLAGGKSQLEGFVPPVFDTLSVRELWGEHPDEPSPVLQNRLFESYIVHNALGQSASVKEIFALRGLVPPAGTGDCAAPKLLEEAFRRGLKPLSMGEFWYGRSPLSGEVRTSGRFYPSCTGKCGPLLSWMMKGLEVEANPLQIPMGETTPEVLYEDDWILAANKPSGMLCVPGKTGVESLMEILGKSGGKLYEVHRLDMDTSGIILFGKSPEAQAALRGSFESRTVEKTYLAHLLPGTKVWKEGFHGTIALPLGCDWNDRPRQMVDRKGGKNAITEFDILKVFPDGSMDVRFFPKTGRTHQLRVHAASPQGLGCPIEGDRLYGAASPSRLMLHAESISFTHPFSGRRLTLRCPPVFPPATGVNAHGI